MRKLGDDKFDKVIATFCRSNRLISPVHHIHGICFVKYIALFRCVVCCLDWDRGREQNIAGAPAAVDRDEREIEFMSVLWFCKEQYGYLLAASIHVRRPATRENYCQIPARILLDRCGGTPKVVVSRELAR